MTDQTEREFAVTFTYIIRATSAQDAMANMAETEPDRITIMPNMGI